jgi:hypothetical protein
MTGSDPGRTSPVGNRGCTGVNYGFADTCLSLIFAADGEPPREEPIMPFTNRVVVVTGSSRRVGHALAGRLVAAGARDVLADVETGTESPSHHDRRNPSMGPLSYLTINPCNAAAAWALAAAHSMDLRIVEPRDLPRLEPESINLVVD